MTPWLVIGAVGLGTYLFRSVMFVVLGDRRLPAWTERPMALVDPAAIGALLGGMLLTHHGRFDPAGPADLAAAVLAFAVVRRGGSVLRGILVGFALLWILALVGAGAGAV
jgi:branched-subunit amino acid transport protein